jgi:hypothetical protein
MKLRINRQEPFQEVKNIIVIIKNAKYSISETIDGRLKINKISEDGEDDYMRVHPCTGNEIDIS